MSNSSEDRECVAAMKPHLRRDGMMSMVLTCFLWVLVLQFRTCDAANWWYLGILEEQQQQQQQVGFPAAASIAATTMMMASDAPAGGTAVYRAFCGVPSDPGNAVSGKNGSGKDADGDDDVVDWETAICRQHPLLADLDANSIRSVSQGALRGIRECQSQFAAERWNCPTFRNSTSVFGEHTMKRGSKETAYIYAVTSAGVVHSVTAACGLGELAECSCDAERNGGRTTAEGWKWGGCSAEIGYGREFGRRLVDSPDEAKIRAPGVKRGIRRRAAMNLLNNEAGRVAVAQLMKNQCRCHGISGSCELKTCWRSLPPFQEVGARLKDRYENSVAISQINELPFKSRGIRNKKRRRRGNTNRKHAGLNSASLLALSDAPAVRNSSSRGTMLSPFWTNTNKNNNNNNAENIDDSRSTSKRRRSSQRRQVASPTSHHGASENKLGNEVPLKLPGMGDKLVYIHESLNYCEGDKRRQIPSTSGRRCSRDSTKGDSCDVLCCGRGYNTQVIQQVEKCNCKFFWCCSVKCQQCDKKIEVHTCK